MKNPHYVYILVSESHPGNTTLDSPQTSAHDSLPIIQAMADRDCSGLPPPIQSGCVRKVPQKPLGPCVRHETLLKVGRTLRRDRSRSSSCRTQGHRIAPGVDSKHLQMDGAINRNLDPFLRTVDLIVDLFHDVIYLDQLAAFDDP